MKTIRTFASRLALIGLVACFSNAYAQTSNVVQDSFTGTSANLNWIPSNGACLTAGNGTGTVPACKGLAYYGSQTQAGLTSNVDPAGSGALRLTNGCAGGSTGTCYGNQNGAIISNTPFSSSQGIQVTFTTYTYSGNRGGGAGNGADGIGFYLLDATKVASSTSSGTTTYAPQIGAFGGSLGYSCSNTNNPHDGMVGAYLGLGMDEFGNFLNGAYQAGYTGDNTATGQQATNTNGGNGQQYQPQRIGLRGYGNVYLSELQALNSSATENDVKNVCQNGGTYSYTTTGPTQYSFAYTYQPNGYYTNLVTTTYSYTPTAAKGSSNYTANLNACTANQPSNTTSGGAGSTSGTAIAIAGGTALYQQGSSTSSTTTTGQVSVTVTTGHGNNKTTTTYTCNTSTSVATTTYSYTQPVSSTGVASATVGTTSTTNDDGYYGTQGPPFVQVNGNYYPVTETTSSTNTFSHTATFPDYAAIPNAYVNLPTTTPIANESALTRSAATPIAYKLQITQTGLLSLWYSYNGGNYVPVLTSQSIGSSNGAMPANFLFGFGGSTGGSENVHEITCFQATPANVSASSAGINVQQTGEVQTGTQVYLAYYHPNNWWGELDSQNLVYNSTTGTVSIASQANWDASCVLTGGSCAVTGATSMTAQGSGSRKMVTWTGGPNDNASSPGAAPFSWGRLTTNEQAWLGSNDNVTNASQIAQDRLSYLQGDRTNEVTQSGSSVVNAAGSYDNFRSRNSVLGDIIDSSPTWVGPPSTSYPNTWADLQYPSATVPENATGATTYGTFATNEASRLNVVYVGANDGFMHGFESGYYNANGTYACTGTNNACTDGTANDGKEVLAYMPGAVLATIHNATTSTLDYSSVNYAHNYYLDATPGTGDLFYNNGWHTWLVSGLGTGGNAIFALDITDLGTTAFGTGNVKGEWSTAVTTTPASGSTPASTSVATTLACASDTSSSFCGYDLGQTVGTPQIRRLHNGQWAIIFGNGFNSVTGHAGIYVMTINNGNINAVNSSTSTSGVYFLDTGVGSTSNPNGIGYVSAVDLDGDHITDYVYAGDVYGNVWRFDLTSSSPANWAASTFGNSSPTPLFTTPPIKTVYTVTTSTSGGNTVTTTSSPTVTTVAPVAVSQQSTYGYGTTSTTNGNTTTYTVISPQPITTQLIVVSTTEPSASSTTPYVLVEFGTGSISPQSVTSGATYSQGPQTLYGIWDWNMGVASTPGSSYAGLTVGATGAPTASAPITQSTLQQQTVTSTTTASGSTSVLGYRTVSQNTVCLVGMTCSTVNSSGNTVSAAGTMYGWYLNMPAYAGVPWVGGSNQTEQVIFSPIESEGAFIVNTTVPANNSPLTCSVTTAAGWTMALNPATGGGFTQSFFADTTGNVISGSISGIALNAVGSPSVVTAQGKPYLVNQTVTGVGTVNQIFPPGGQSGQRLTWLQLH